MPHLLTFRPGGQGYLNLIDFGLSKQLEPGKRTYTICGTPMYIAPEVLKKNPNLSPDPSTRPNPNPKTPTPTLTLTLTLTLTPCS